MARSPSLRNGWPFCAMIIALFLAALLLSPLRPLGVAAADPCNPTDPSYSVIVCENSKPGSPSSEWDVAGSGSASIQGFSTDMSVNRGSTVGFKISSPQSSSFRLDIYRLGYYGGAGARKIAGIVPSDAARAAATQQPACLRRASTGLVDCGNWKQTAHWKVPSDAVSGMYLALLSRTDCPNGAGQASHIYFVVRADGESADIVVQASDTTWQGELANLFSSFLHQVSFPNSFYSLPQQPTTLTAANRSTLLPRGSASFKAMHTNCRTTAHSPRAVEEPRPTLSFTPNIL